MLVCCFPQDFTNNQLILYTFNRLNHTEHIMTWEVVAHYVGRALDSTTDI